MASLKAALATIIGYWYIAVAGYPSALGKAVEPNLPPYHGAGRALGHLGSRCGKTIVKPLIGG